MSNSWVYEELGEICKVTSGGTPKRDEPSYWNGEIPWVTTAEIKGGVINDSAEKITDAAVKGSSAKIFPSKTVLVAMYGQGKTRGMAGILQIEAATNQACAAILPSESFDPYFLFQYLNSKYHYLRSLSNLGGQQNLSGGIIKSLVVPVPTLVEQKKITDILVTWDKSIEATERLLENSKKRKKALMQQLLTGKKRLPGFGRDWIKTLLSGVAKIEMGTSPPSDAYNYQGFGLPLVQGNADIKDRRSCPRVFTSEITKEAYPGDILMSVRAPVGEISMSAHHCCIGRGVCSIKADESSVNQGFLFQLLLNLEPSWSSISQGSTFESVNSKDVKNLQLTLPSLLEQVAIAEVLSTADAETDLIERRVRSLRSEKSALMQQLLTGRKRVKVEAVPA